MKSIDRTILNKKQDRIVLSKGKPSAGDLKEGLPALRDTVDGLYWFIKNNGEVYSSKFNKLIEPSLKLFIETVLESTTTAEKFLVLEDTEVMYRTATQIANDIGVGTGDSPRFEGIELGHASDTTLTRASAGDVNIEGNAIYRAGGTDVAIADGGTGQSDLNNLITMGTHTTGNYVATLTAGTGLTSTGATSGESIAHSLSVDGAQTGITSIINTGLRIGHDAHNEINLATDNEIIFQTNDVNQIYLTNNMFGPKADSDVDLGTTGERFKDAYVDSITVTGEVDADSLDIEGDADINGTLETDALTIGGVSVEAGADVTDTTNVTAAGALMDSECTNLAAVKAFTGEANATADQTSGEILGLIEDGVDSVHYKDDSIDTAHIADDQVTYAKIQNVTDARMLGNNAGSDGNVTEMSKANVLTFLNAEDGATADQSQADINGLAITTTGALNSGSITSGFGAIDNGSSAITSTGTITGGTIRGTSTIRSDGTIVALSPELTVAGTDDYSISSTQTLNVAVGGMATQEYRQIKTNLTQTDATGWDSVYLIDQQVGGTSKFNVTNGGAGTFAGTVTSSAGVCPGPNTWAHSCGGYKNLNTRDDYYYFQYYPNRKDWGNAEQSPTSISYADAYSAEWLAPAAGTLTKIDVVVRASGVADDVEFFVYKGTMTEGGHTSVSLTLIGQSDVCGIDTTAKTFYKTRSIGSSNSFAAGDLIFVMMKKDDHSGTAAHYFSVTISGEYT